VSENLWGAWWGHLECLYETATHADLLMEAYSQTVTDTGVDERGENERLSDDCENR